MGDDQTDRLPWSDDDRPRGMPRLGESRGTHSSGSEPSDHALIVRLLASDEKAMRQLVDRYDRLIRYMIFKSGRRYCDRDSGWLDARANETWIGIVQSLRRAGPQNLPPNIRSYFARIARNKCLDAVKKADARTIIPFDEHIAEAEGAAGLIESDNDPHAMLENIEQLEALRDCMARLNEQEQLLCSEIGLIVEKRWREAADRLEMAESTLRSRWRNVLGKLKICLEKKTQKNIAPDGQSTDS